MGEKRVKGFSYDVEEDADVIDFINKETQGSRYIWELVRRDMERRKNRSKKRDFIIMCYSETVLDDEK